MNNTPITSITMGTIFRQTEEQDGTLVLSPSLQHICIPLNEVLQAFPGVSLDGTNENPPYRRVTKEGNFFGVFVPAGTSSDKVEAALIAEGRNVEIQGGAFHDFAKLAQ